MRFLLSLGLLCFAAAAPLLEESVEEALEQSQADSTGEASWSKDLTNNWPIPKHDQDRTWASPGGIWKRQNVLETAGITHKIRKRGLARHTDKEAVQMETISSLLRDIENSIPSSGRSDSDDDDTRASEEKFNLMNRELVDDTDDNESFDDLTTDEAQVQKWKLFKSLLGKRLRVLKHKLSEEQTIEEAEIEKFKIFKKIFKKVAKGIKKFVKLFKKIKPKIKNRSRRRYDDDDDDIDDRRRPYKYAMVDSGTSIGTNENNIQDRERERSDILRTFFVDALGMINSRTGRTGRSPGQVEPLPNEPPTDAAPNVDQMWTTGEPDEMSQEQSFFKLYQKLKRKIKRLRSG